MPRTAESLGSMTVMFGTGLAPNNFADYITFVKDFIPETYWDDVFFNNANRIYQLGL